MTAPATQPCTRSRLQNLQAMQAVATEHLPLVGAMVARFPHHGYEPEELYQQGCIGLMKALARYDPDHGTAFSTYAAAMILGEMRMLSRLNAPIHISRVEREKRRQIRQAHDRLSAHLGREPTVDELAAAVRLPPMELILLTEEISVTSADAAAQSGSSLLDSLADDDPWQDRLALKDMICHLPEQDQALLRLRHMDGLSQAETAARLGLTQVQVSRRERMLHRQLRDMWQEE